MAAGDFIGKWLPGEDNSPMENRPPVMLVPGTQIKAWRFDPDADNTIFLDGIVGLSTTGPLPTGITVRGVWVTPANGTGAIRIGASITAVDTGADTSAGGTYGTEVTANNTVDATAGEVLILSQALTSIDGTANGDGFRIKLRREASNAGDTHTGYAYLISVLAIDT